jgi:phosphoribosylamine--glycine ligase
VDPVLHDMTTRGTPFVGVLYVGLAVTGRGPKVIEFNARFGDPEIQAILPRLAVALGPLLLAAARGDLRAALTGSHLEGARLPTLPGGAVAVVLAAAGYPGMPRAGDPIEGLDDAAAADALVFHAGTARDPDGTFRTAGGRVLTVVGRGPDVETARAVAMRGAGLIHAPGLQLRHDIGLDGATAALAVAAGR